MTSETVFSLRLVHPPLPETFGASLRLFQIFSSKMLKYFTTPCSKIVSVLLHTNMMLHGIRSSAGSDFSSFCPPVVDLVKNLSMLDFFVTIHKFFGVNLETGDAFYNLTFLDQLVPTEHFRGFSQKIGKKSQNQSFEKSYQLTFSVFRFGSLFPKTTYNIFVFFLFVPQTANETFQKHLT